MYHIVQNEPFTTWGGMEWNVVLANYVTYVTQVTVVTSLAIEH